MTETLNSKQAVVQLPKYCYVRGKKIYARIQDETGRWCNKTTPFNVDEIDKARRYVATLVRGYTARRAADDGTVRLRGYASQWVDERERRGIGAAAEERSRLESYIYPILGHFELTEIRPRHARDFVRTLKSYTGDDKLAPRTIIHLYQLLHNVFSSAVIDEYVDGNPIVIESGELPQKIDKDPEWRVNATYTVAEIEKILSDTRIPPERRMQYALKALTGMRHGEVAALCWRHIDLTIEPLGRINIVQSYNSSKRVIKSTKTGQTRLVPVHAELARMLIAWRDTHWPIVYGMVPGPDHLVIPTRTMNCVNGKEAINALKRDLTVLELRLKAGKIRARGGHDMRSWYETRLIEDGADAIITRRTTHAPPKNVSGGYERFSWAVLCRELAKLQVKVPVDDPLPTSTDHLQACKKASARWNLVTPSGLEPELSRSVRSLKPVVSDDESNNVHSRAIAANHKSGTISSTTRITDENISIAHAAFVDLNDDALRALDVAALHNDYELVRAIIKQMRKRT